MAPWMVEAKDKSYLSETEDLQVRANVSASKLQNSLFLTYEARMHLYTSNTLTKLQDSTLLRECIASVAICSFGCKPQ